MTFPWQQMQWQKWLAQGQQRERLGHAYLLAGTVGIGLSEFAHQMAKGLLCQQPGLEACGHCIHCHQFTQETHPDFFKVAVLEDKKEVSVDQIRQLTDKIFSTSHQGGYKVALIEQVENLNRSAFNALLKTLEEPPAQTVILLTSYHTGRLPATIISRCRQIRFSTPAFEEAYQWLHQAVPLADDALLKKSLKVNWGAPIQAKHWIEQKGFEFEATWQADLKALRLGKMAVSQVVEKWLKLEHPEQVFDLFYLWTVTAIRAALYADKVEFNENWVVFQKGVLQAKQVWQQNANKELLLEGLCLTWLQHQQAGFVADSPLIKAIQGQEIRGHWI